MFGRTHRGRRRLLAFRPSGRVPGGSDTGSIAPLAVGFVVIALLLAFLIAAITDLYLARRQLQALADSAALAASDSFEPAPGSEPGLVFSAPAARSAAVRYLDRAAIPRSLGSVRVGAGADGTSSVEIRLQAHYSPPLLSPSVPELIELHAAASARGALRFD